MISLEHVRREYPTRHGSVTVLNDVSFRIHPGEKVGIIGKNGAGKSTMIRLISGAEKPDAGKVSRTMSVSWPLAFSGAFQSTLTGLDNLRFICRIYGKNWQDNVDFVDDFSELGRYLREPVGSYSSGMRSRLAFALSMVIDFDCYLIDEVMAVGDYRFQERCHEELFVKRRDKAMIFVSHDPSFIRERCERASVLSNGTLHNFDDLEHAFHYYFSDQMLQPPQSNGTEIVNADTPAPQLDMLLFGRSVPDTSDRFGTAFAEWLFSHPLNSDPEVSRHRLATKVGDAGLALLAEAFTSELPTDYSWRSIHSALAAYAESRQDCDVSRHFLETFETMLPVEGPGGLWETMANEGGSIRRIAVFDHKASSRQLPIRLDFVRPATEDHVRNELAEFRMSDDGVSCTLQICHQVNYAVRLFATFPYLLKYFETNDLDGEFAVSLGDEGLNERVISFCSQMANFLVVDPIFVGSGGYQDARNTYNNAPPWRTRRDMAYWRGTDTGAFRYRDLREAPRVKLAELSITRPDLIDAKITQVELRPGWEYKKDYYLKNHLIGENEPQDRLLEFKYQIDIDGNTNSWPGLFLKLLSGSPVLKVESELGFQQWYYPKLRAWENYVPVESDIGDLVEKLEWLHGHPDEAEAIGARGRKLASSITYDSAIAEAVATVQKLVKINKKFAI